MTREAVRVSMRLLLVVGGLILSVFLAGAAVGDTIDDAVCEVTAPATQTVNDWTNQHVTNDSLPEWYEETTGQELPTENWAREPPEDVGPSNECVNMAGPDVESCVDWLRNFLGEGSG